ncbi:MAG: precorrin-6y C5,15-methyltransferase (decarboxylating) subunit CbiE [Pseudomonadota bacterium]
MAPPWLTLIGLGEDGLAGLSSASRDALSRAEVVFGGPRHLDLAGVGMRGQPWAVPFDAGPVLALRGRAVVVLASGDPFWHGVGGTLAVHLTPGEWVCHPGPSTPSLVAARLGWRLEEVTALGLHAAPFARLIPHLHHGARIIATLRDDAAPADMAAWLVGQGFGASTLHVLERLGGPQERLRQTRADAFDLKHIAAPVAVAIHAEGLGLPRGFGLPDDAFAHDGQITKRPIRALTLSALGPRPGQHLWDIGAGSGSVSVEWCLAGGTAQAVEAKPLRAVNIRANAAAYGVDHRLTVIEGTASAALAGLAVPDAVFVGGGMDAALFAALQPMRGTRLVANSVTLETESLLADLHARHGGSLLRIDVATATPLGRMRGWTAARPVVQWSVVL